MPYHAHKWTPLQSTKSNLFSSRSSVARNHPVDFPEDGRKNPRRSLKCRARSSIFTTATAFLAGRGFYNGHTRASRCACLPLPIPMRTSTKGFFRAQDCGLAVQLRRDALRRLDAVTDAYRVIHSEGDGLSGLVVDRFAKHACRQEYFSAGFFKQRDLIKRCLLQHFPEAEIYAFAEEHVQKQESFDLTAPTSPPPTVIHEHGVKFHAAPGSKHKTGFFADQRDNRLLLSEFCKGARVLDLCCNSGGFGIYAKSCAAAPRKWSASIWTKRFSRSPRRNARLNKVKVRFIQADIFALAARCRRQQSRQEVRCRRPRSGEDDARPRASDSRAQEISRHEQTRARRGQAGRHSSHLFVHRPR